MADNMNCELKCWLDEFKNELEPEQHCYVCNILKANGFETRLKLKLILDDELKIMFSTGTESLPLGAKALLAYKLNILRDESPLVSKSKPHLPVVDEDLEDKTSKAHKKVSFNNIFSPLCRILYVFA